MIPLFDNNQRRRTPVVTLTLIVANLAVFLYQLVLAQQEALMPFVARFAFTPAFLAEDPSPERAMTIFTAMFLHGGLLHLLFNMWFLWLFGNIVEDRIGSFRYLFLYLLAGVGAAAAQFAVAPTSAIPMLGASGAVAGVLGAYLIFFPKAIIFTLVPLWFAPIVPVPAFVFLFLWFLLQIWQGIGAMFGAEGTGGVAWWAHFGGFVAGFLISRKWKKR